MLVGGGGRPCSGADHGIGITRVEPSSFAEGSIKTEDDFGYGPYASYSPSQSYPLDLWIR